MTSSSGLLVGLVVGLIPTVMYLVYRVRKLDTDLWTVRLGAYSLATMLEDRVGDLEDSLKDAGITLSRRHVDKRRDWYAMTPQEQMAQFEAVAAEAERRLRGFGGHESL